MAGARDGQLAVRRGTDSPPWALQMFDDELGLWLTLAQADELEDAMRAGIPVLRGPYVIDYTDIPHHGDTKTLWTPELGDVLLRLFADPEAAIVWDQGSRLLVTQDYNTEEQSTIAIGDIVPVGSYSLGSALDTIESANSLQTTWAGNGTAVTAKVFHSTAAVQVVYIDDAEVPVAATQGHVELYTLVARAATP